LALSIGLLLVSSLLTVPEPAFAEPAADPTTLVNPFVGTGSGGEFVGSVNTFPGAVAPFGMVSWSPERLSVIGPGTAARVCTVLGRSNVDNGLPSVSWPATV
jgi:putative alpha-1,2-mannosidase